MECSIFGARKENKEKGKQRKHGSRKESRIRKLQQEYLQVTFCTCDFLVGLDMHGFACWFMVLLLLVTWFFQVMTLVVSLDLAFSRCHGMLGNLSQFSALAFKMDLGIWGGCGLKFHSKRPRNTLTSFGRIHGKA